MSNTTRIIGILIMTCLLALAAYAAAPAHESGHIYLLERKPTTEELCAVGAGKIHRYYNVSGTHADDNDNWARRQVSGNSWVVKIYASKANLDNTDLVHVLTYIRTLTC